MTFLEIITDPVVIVYCITQGLLAGAFVFTLLSILGGDKS